MLVTVNADDYPAEVSSTSCRTVLVTRDTMYLEVYMPTDFRIRSLQCTFRNQQEPEMWFCSYIGLEDGNPELQGSSWEFEPTEDLSAELAADALEHDWTIV